MLVGLVVGCVVVVARHDESVVLGLALMLVGYKREREVEQAHKHQEDSDNTGNDAS